MSQHDADVIVVGAGVSGLCFANACASAGLSVVVIERSARVGGCVHTHRDDAAIGDYWLELGTHSCFNSYGKLLAVLEAHGLLGAVIGKRRLPFRLWVEEQPRSIASQLNFPELAVSLPRLLWHRKRSRSVAEYFRPFVGARNYERVFGPAFDAVLCQDAASFPAECLFRRKRRRKDVMKGFTFAQGLQQMVDALAAGPGLELHRGAAVTSIEPTARGYRLGSSAGNAWDAPLVAVATPPSEAARLLAGVQPALARLLERIPGVAVESLGVVVRKQGCHLPELGGIIGRKQDFYSAVSRDVVSHAHLRGFTFHFRPNRVDRESKLGLIERVLGAARGEFLTIGARTSSLPALSLHHDRLTGDIQRELAERPVALLGNYFTGVSLEECAGRAFAEFRRLASVGLVPAAGVAMG